MPDMQMIENSDRGITLNKALAWSVFVFLMGLAAVTIQRDTVREAKLAENTGAIAAATVERGTIQERLRNLERQRASDRAASEVRFSSIIDLLARIDKRLERMEDRQ